MATETSATDANKELVRRQIEAVFNRGEAEAIPTFWAADFQEWTAATSQMLPTAFPDFHIAIERLVAEGDTVVAQMRWTGTHQGPFCGFPLTGKAFEITAIRIYRRADGKIVESVAVQDRLGILQQLGLVPIPGKGDR